MELKFQLKDFGTSNESCRVIGVFQGDDKSGATINVHKEYTQMLTELNTAGVFKAARGSTYFFRNGAGQGSHLLFAGLGKASTATGESYRVSGANIIKRLESEKIKSAALSFESFQNKQLPKKLSIAQRALALGEGLLLARYNFDIYKTEKTRTSVESITFYSRDAKTKTDLSVALQTATATNDAVTIARDFSNEPGSHLTPMELAKRTQKLAKEYGISCKVLDKKELEKEKMGALLGVGQGSVNPPCLIVMEYKPKKKSKKTLAFVGKGVTFDSGGISLKPGQGMEEMKHDMSGAADVIAATLLCARLKVATNIICVVAAAENMPDGNAIIPSGILYTRSGKTIEVQNTDAEGRLILADALDYVQDLNPDAIIDAATLTGAVVVALGSVTAGLMGNDQKLIDQFKVAAEATEERFWQLPLYQEYSDDLKSKIADIKNIGGEKGGGSSKGGAFLKEFIRPGNKWIHLDIAGTAWNTSFLPYNPKGGASGHSVRTLVRFAMDF